MHDQAWLPVATRIRWHLEDKVKSQMRRQLSNVLGAAVSIKEGEPRLGSGDQACGDPTSKG